MVRNKDELVKAITAWIRERMEKAGVERLAIDVSGGVDSAVVAALCVRTAGADRVIGVYSGVHSSDTSRRRARVVAQTFGFSLAEFDLDGVFEAIVSQATAQFDRLGLAFPVRDDPKNRVVFGSLRSTLRAPVGRFVNRAFGGGLRVGTGNRDEDELVRFYQKGGDGEVDISPVAGLFKSEVWALAEHLGVPREVIDATPTPDLWAVGEAHTDEGELADLTGVKLTYTRPGAMLGTIEWASRENARRGVVTGEAATLPDDALASRYGYDAWELKVLRAVRKLELASRHKAAPPPVLERASLLEAGLVD